MKNDVADSDKGSESIGGIVFSHKEMLVIRELVIGESYKVVASRLSMSERTVQYHVRNIMNKIRCNSKSDLMAFFNANGIFPDDEYQSYVQKSLRFSQHWAGKAVFLISSLIIASFILLYIYSRNNNALIMDLPEFHENFLQRPELLSKINEILKSQSGVKMAVIVGGGGAGKTTLAREILRSFKSSIVWEINAETDDSIYNSFFDLANHLAVTIESKKELEIIKNLTDTEEKRKRLIKLTSALLRESGNWCLLFDNVNEMRNVHRYLPHRVEYWGPGKVMITTRNEDIREVNFIKSSWVVNIGFLTKKEQQKLFCDILYKSEFPKLEKNLQLRVRKFLANIPKMPLDICAAAYYLKNTKISLDEYEKIMATSYKDLNVAQGALLEENVNYGRTRYGIISSVFEEILKENPKFKTLLLCMCMLDSQHIPKGLLRIAADSITADKFIYHMRKNSLISDGRDDFSIHRSSQSIGLDYVLNVLTAEEKKQMIETLVSVITPYEKLETLPHDLMKMLPHLEAFLHKLSNVGLQDFIIEKSKIDLLLTIASIHRYKAYRIIDSLSYFKKALELNQECKCLDSKAIALIHLKIGEIYTLMSANNEATLYLEKSLSSLNDNLTELAKNYRLLGIVHMRKDRFEEANKCFEKAINILEQDQGHDINIREIKSNIYADMAFNYSMNGINRADAPKAVKIMKKAVEILATAKIDPGSKSQVKITGRLTIHKGRLAGIYNALGKYDLALKTAQESEDIIRKSPMTDSDIIYAQGIIARERGLAHLRLNKVAEAYDYFMEAKRIFSKASVGEYLFRLKMHEAESLIRLNRLDEAFRACEAMFFTKDRERNNYCDLFFNTCYYHAAVIKYRQNDVNSAREYFAKFFVSMRALCKSILSREKFNELLQQNAFQENPSEMKTCFQNSLKVFEAIYWKDYEFTKYYVAENLKLFP